MSLKLQDVTKQFGIKTALKDISIEFNKGRLHSIVGENGAGKSTLVKILSNKLCLTSGKILNDENLSIGIVEQHPVFAKSISLKQNIFLGINESKEKKELMKNLLLKWAPELNPDHAAENISGAEKFYASLIAVLLRKPQVLILDEPGTYLNDAERVSLYNNLTELKNEGICIIVVTHSKREMINFSDEIFLLKKGSLVQSFFEVQKKSLEEKSKVLETIENSIKSSVIEKKSILSVDDSKINFSISFNKLCAEPVDKPLINDITFSVEAGKIVMIQGLAEAGLLTLEDCISGMSRIKSGTFTFSKESEVVSVKKISPEFLRKDLCKKLGLKIGIVPSDKYYRGADQKLTVSEMLYSASINLKLKDYKSYVDSVILKSQIDAKPDDKISNLSGGMLQRLILERELYFNPDILIFCEPFAGFDMEKIDLLCNHLLELKAAGKGVLILSAEQVSVKIWDELLKLEGGRLYA